MKYMMKIMCKLRILNFLFVQYMDILVLLCKIGGGL